MPSQSLARWQLERATALDEIASAHQSIGGNARGRRYATQQLNYAYAVLLCSQFQGFCRDLHDECADILAQTIASADISRVLRDSLLRDRKIDRGNPNPGNIGADFERFLISFWPEVIASDQRNGTRRDRLNELTHWRNAIAHQDFHSLPQGSATLRLQRVRIWRKACESLATTFDSVLYSHLTSLIGSSPW